MKAVGLAMFVWLIGANVLGQAPSPIVGQYIKARSGHVYASQFLNPGSPNRLRPIASVPQRFRQLTHVLLQALLEHLDRLVVDSRRPSIGCHPLVASQKVADRVADSSVAQAESSWLSYGWIVHLRLLSTLPHDNAVTFSYELESVWLGKQFHLSIHARPQARHPPQSGWLDEWGCLKGSCPG